MLFIVKLEWRWVLAFAIWSGAALSGQETRIGIASGAGHGIFLKPDGTLWTWGANAYGQLGREANEEWAPAPVPGVDGILRVAAGAEFSMALKSNGTVWTWGQNQDGQLGNGITANSPEPTPITGLTRVVAIAAGGNHAMALDDNGSVWEWGSVPNRSSITRPLRVPDLANIVAIAAGDNHSIVLDRKGHVWVWGDHGAGELADHCFVSSSPQQLPGLSDITAVAGGYQLTVALRKDGTVWTIGYGAAGQLGNGSTTTSTQPVMATGLSGVRAISARYMTVLALKKDGTVWSWGSNHFRQLGNTRIGSEDSGRPVRTAALSDVVAIAAGGSHSAAVTAKGTVWTWGQNDRGALGADPDALDQSDSPMQPGQTVPPPCNSLFACLTDAGRLIRICGDPDESNVGQWSHIHYRFGPERGLPDFMFPAEPDQAPPSLFFSEAARKNETQYSVRFSNAGFTYRVYYSADSGAGVEVKDAKGNTLNNIRCAERPAVYNDYLRENLPCDPTSPRACKKGQALR